MRKPSEQQADPGGTRQTTAEPKRTAGARARQVAPEDAVTEPSMATLARRAVRVPPRAAKGDDDIMSQQQSLPGMEPINGA